MRTSSYPTPVLALLCWSLCFAAAAADAVPSASAVELPSLGNVRLLDSPFTDAVRANRDYLLAVDPDRLLAPFLREAGLEPRAPSYGNWENSGLDGHTAGHYLSALAFMIVTEADTSDHEFQRRLDHMLAELERCQESSGDGYLGGVPGSDALWKAVAAGDVRAAHRKWVPWYNLHKTFAGLRDVWWLTGDQRARNLLVRYGDWCDNLVSGLSDRQMQQMLSQEFGGMNETLADIYAITGNEKYLHLAERFQHDAVLNPIMDHRDDLTGKHANTQIPKVIGLQRIASLTGDERAASGAHWFWENVTGSRTVAFGGNSVAEHFNDPTDFNRMLEHREGPENCNTYNMLRLTEQLFSADPRAAYADYYERALYNQILSSINTVTPGYVYFTPIRPEHYRVYSTPENCFWCCVGTGMENPGRYGQFIYGKADDGIYVNLFIPSEWKQADLGLTVRQETRFPDEPRTRLTLNLDKRKKFTLHLRHPAWVPEGELALRINGEPVDLTSTPSSYVAVTRRWRNGDQIELDLPMHTTVERLPDGSDWVAILHGPIVLAWPSGTNDLEGLFADGSRMGHVAHGPLVPLDQVPSLLCSAADLPSHVKPDSTAGPLHFRLTDVVDPPAADGLPLIPFFRLHESRYQMYWQLMTREKMEARAAQLAAAERARAAREAATLDQVAPGEQQPEVEHDFVGEDTESGINGGRHWRHGRLIQYTLDTRGERHVNLSVTYWGGDSGRTFDIFANDTLLATQKLTGEKGGEFIEKFYPIPASVLDTAPDNKVTIRFVATEWVAGGLYDVRLMKADPRPNDAAQHPRDTRARNPIIHADVPDIAMIRVGDTYYMSSTTMHMSPGLPIMKSHDLVNWELASYAYDRLVENDKMNLNNGENCYGQGTWASSLRYQEGTFYATTFSSTSGKTHVYTTTDPDNGPWTAKSFSPMLHDHSLFFDDDGRVYMLYGGGTIRIKELLPDLSGVKPDGVDQVLIENGNLLFGADEVGGLNAEGSQLFKVNGTYYLFNIASPRSRWARTVLIHRAQSITGPYEGRIALDDRQIAQGGLIDTPDGRWYAYLFGDRGAVGRIPYLLPVTWTDGWPVLGVDGRTPDTLDLPDNSDGILGIVASDDFDRAPGDAVLPLPWQWNHNPDNDHWTLLPEAGLLRLTTSRVDKDVLSARNMLTQRTFGPVGSASTALDVSHLKNGDVAGLIALQKRYGYVAVKMQDDQKSIVMVSAQHEAPEEIERVALNQDTVYFKIDCDFRNLTDKAYFYYSLDGRTWKKIGDTLQMAYTLPHFMGYRYGLFNYATESPGGHVDFDFYRIERDIDPIR